MCFRPCRTREEPEINLILLIGALLVILVLLMITTTYSRHTELEVSLSTVEVEKATKHPGQTIVSVTADDVYSVDKQVLDAHDATSLVDTLRNVADKAGGLEPITIVDAGAQAVYQAVVDVMEAARMVDLSHLTFATQTGNTR